MTGESAVNTPGNVRAVATDLEYRRSLTDSIDMTISGIDEGKNKFTNRVGIAPELWWKRNVLDDRLSLSVGAGVDAGLDGRRKSEGYASDKFAAGVTWHRILTNYNRDADVVTAGIGVNF
jgi:hypothetical protein